MVNTSDHVTSGIGGLPHDGIGPADAAFEGLGRRSTSQVLRVEHIPWS